MDTVLSERGPGLLRFASPNAQVTSGLIAQDKVDELLSEDAVAHTEPIGQRIWNHLVAFPGSGVSDLLERERGAASNMTE